MNLRLVASDLDGTLLSGDSRLAPRTIEALQQTAAQGVEVVAVTGRSHRTCVELLRPAECIRWAICSNGATVWDFEAEDVVVRRPLDNGQVVGVLAAVEQAFPTAGLSWETGTGHYVTEQWITARRAVDPRFRNRLDLPPVTFDFDHGEVLKLMLAHDELITFDWLDALRPHLSDDLSISTSGATFVEVTRADANKGDALADLCRMLGIGPEATVAFGDHANDLPMLAWAGRSYAMANADDSVLAVADAVAPPHHEDGVAQVLEGLLGGGSSAAG
ncbi:MAG: Cof-type HAD-IIB family hydrolase [Actinomycetota bacterium]